MIPAAPPHVRQVTLTHLGGRSDCYFVYPAGQLCVDPHGFTLREVDVQTLAGIPLCGAARVTDSLPPFPAFGIDHAAQARSNHPPRLGQPPRGG